VERFINVEKVKVLIERWLKFMPARLNKSGVLFQ